VLLAPAVSIVPSVSVGPAVFVDRTLRSVRVPIDQFQTRTRYHVTVTRLRDCSGNEIDPAHNSISLALPEPPERGDVLLNELLFNPKPNGFDFVEIVNTSDKFLNLKNWKLANLNNGRLNNAKPVSQTDFLLEPGGYLVLTESANSLLAFYTHAKAGSLYNMDLPALNDDEGSVALADDQNRLLDTLYYDARWHDAVLKDPEGVSLERISWQHPSQLPSNWKSAPASVGFATPGFANANARPEVLNEQAIRIDPEVFSPRQPPYFSRINYTFGQSGWVANVKILDQQGRLIKTVAHNETLGFEGFLRWDGDDNHGAMVRSGYYVAWVEVFDLTGRLQTFRQRVVVMNR